MESKRPAIGNGCHVDFPIHGLASGGSDIVEGKAKSSHIPKLAGSERVGYLGRGARRIDVLRIERIQRGHQRKKLTAGGLELEILKGSGGRSVCENANAIDGRVRGPSMGCAFLDPIEEVARCPVGRGGVQPDHVGSGAIVANAADVRPRFINIQHRADAAWTKPRPNWVTCGGLEQQPRPVAARLVDGDLEFVNVSVGRCPIEPFLPRARKTAIGLDPVFTAPVPKSPTRGRCSSA